MTKERMTFTLDKANVEWIRDNARGGKAVSIVVDELVQQARSSSQMQIVQSKLDRLLDLIAHLNAQEGHPGSKAMDGMDGKESGFKGILEAHGNVAALPMGRRH